MTADQILELGPALAEYLPEFADCFGRREPRGKLEVYVRGQLSTLPRKSAEPMALAAGIRPRSLQEFLASDDWDEDRLRERLQRLVAREHADVQSIGIIDESGHPKKGRETARVHRQDCGNTGKIDNCVMTVHRTYSRFDSRFHTMIDSDLYLPQAWHDDRARCRRVKIPDDVVYRPKYDIALEQSDRARAHGVSFAWITADEWYAQKPAFLRGLEERHQRYVLEVPKNFRAWLHDPTTAPPDSRQACHQLAEVLERADDAAVAAVPYQGHRQGTDGLGSEGGPVLAAAPGRNRRPVLVGRGAQHSGPGRGEVLPQQRRPGNTARSRVARGLRPLARRALPARREDRTGTVALRGSLVPGRQTPPAHHPGQPLVPRPSDGTTAGGKITK